MSSENLKLEKDLCRCCHSEGSFKNLAAPFKIGDIVEIYSDILKECYDIDMAPVQGVLSAETYTICEVCVIRLRDAAEFKKQVLSCEERFKDMYNRIVIKAATSIEVEVKQEIVDSEPDDEFKEDLSQDVNDDDDDFDESMDLKISDEDEIPLEVTKKRKCKTRTTVKNATVKTKKKTKRESSADTENDAVKKKGRVWVPIKTDCQIVQPRYCLKEEDYKKNGDVYTCTRCDKAYKKINSLKSHIKLTHYKIATFICPICSDCFFTHAPLIDHKLEVHNLDERVKCSLCNKLFNTKKLLARHTKQFHMLGEVGARYKCEFCDYVTFKAKDMYRHKFKHKTVKDQHCKYCKKSFKRRTTLNLHEKIHTDDRKKVCNVCGQAFVQKASLNYHMTKYHPEVNF